MRLEYSSGLESPSDCWLCGPLGSLRLQWTQPSGWCLFATTQALTVIVPFLSLWSLADRDRAHRRDMIGHVGMSNRVYTHMWLRYMRCSLHACVYYSHLSVQILYKGAICACVCAFQVMHYFVYRHKSTYGRMWVFCCAYVGCICGYVTHIHICFVCTYMHV